MVEVRIVKPPRYVGGVATLAIPKRSSLCQSHASWFRVLRLGAGVVITACGAGIIRGAVSEGWDQDKAGGCEHSLQNTLDPLHHVTPPLQGHARSTALREVLIRPATL